MTGRNGAARPLIVELVGPAGVGKSALAERLRARPDVVRASVWNLPAALLIESAVRSLPLLLRLCVVTRALPREELKQIVRLNALRLFISRRVAGAAVVVLDEGPVFALSWLRVFGHPRLQNGRAEPWWLATYAVWAALLAERSHGCRAADRDARRRRATSRHADSARLPQRHRIAPRLRRESRRGTGGRAHPGRRAGPFAVRRMGDAGPPRGLYDRGRRPAHPRTPAGDLHPASERRRRRQAALRRRCHRRLAAVSSRRGRGRRRPRVVRPHDHRGGPRARSCGPADVRAPHGEPALRQPRLAARIGAARDESRIQAHGAAGGPRGGGRGARGGRDLRRARHGRGG